MSIINDSIDRACVAREIIVGRANLTAGELLHAAETLDKIACVGLDDLLCAPAFDSSGNANAKTPEWRQWAAIDDLIQQARRVSHELHRAYEDGLGRERADR